MFGTKTIDTEALTLKEEAMIQLYDFELSGNAYKVRLFLSILGLEYEKINVKVLEGEQKTRDILPTLMLTHTGRASQ